MTTPPSEARLAILIAAIRAGADTERAAAKQALCELAREDGAEEVVRALVEALAERASEAESREELVARLQRETARIRYIAHAGAMLASTTEPRSTLGTLARIAVPELADWAAVDLFVDAERVERLAVAHVDPAKVALVEELGRRYPPNLDDPADGLGQILRTGEPQLVPELPPGLIEAAAKDEDHLCIMRALELRSYVCVPIASRGRVRGALTLISAESGRRFGPDDLEIAQEIARRASIALDVADAMDALRATSLRLEHADRRKDDFLAMLGHELRNPLAAITTASELLRLSPTDEAVMRRARETIARQAGHMQRMLRDLLDVARVTRGKLELEREPVDIAAIVRDTAEDHRADFDRADVALELDVPDQPLTIEGDRTRLVQVVANLLHNARKFTERGGRAVVRLRSDGEDVVLVVSDDGVGIAKDALPGLFQPFVQAKRVHDRNGGGLGLGLALARGLVTRHGGTIDVHSDGIGRGAAFTVRLPRVSRSAMSTDASAEAAAHSLRVLVVEDDRDAGDMMQLLLEALGHDVELATDGPSALDRARSGRFALVLCDIGLPGEMDGHAVARALRGTPEVGDPMIVAVTGFGPADHLTRARDAGFDRLLTKPLDGPALQRLIEAALARAS